MVEATEEVKIHLAGQPEQFDSPGVVWGGAFSMTSTRSFIAAAFLLPFAAIQASARVYSLGPYQGGAAAAQYNYQRYGETGYAREGDVRNTCFKMCRRDMSPCDPPAFKQADGRCSPFD